MNLARYIHCLHRDSPMLNELSHRFGVEIVKERLRWIRILAKEKKSCKVVTRIIKDIREVYENNGETLGTVLSECSFMMTGKDGQDVRETVNSVIAAMVAGKGARKAFEQLVSEDSWNERVKCMRVPD